MPACSWDRVAGASLGSLQPARMARHAARSPPAQGFEHPACLGAVWAGSEHFFLGGESSPWLLMLHGIFLAPLMTDFLRLF